MTLNPGEVISLDGLKLDRTSCLIVSGAMVTAITHIEASILEILIENTPRAVSREALVKGVWETEYTDDSRLLTQHIGSLRKKLATNQVWKIETVRGFGYRLVRRNP